VSTRPLVTIGLPTYNGARFLSETLESLLAQDLADFELVISDNGSTDDTERICRQAVASDRRVRYERSASNRGAAWNYNNVLALARGRYFKWAADDDLCLPSFVSSCVDVLERSPTAVVAWPQTTLIDENGSVNGDQDDHALDLRDADPVDRLAGLLSHRVEWHPVFGLIRTDVLRQTEGIGAFVLADVALLAELVLRGQFHQVPERLFLRRYHDQRSLVANPSFEEHLAWYDPNRAKRRAVLPNARLVQELLRRVRAAPLRPAQRLRADYVVVRRWGAPHWRQIGGEVKRALPVVGRRFT
jgi:glycosyltransferase involved in cell wall biosynthesis